MSHLHLDSSAVGAKRYLLLKVGVLMGLMAPSACGTTTLRGAHGSGPGHYGYSQTPVGLDSPSATCRNSLSACAALYGKEAASATAVLKAALDATTKTTIEAELVECANSARLEVLKRYSGQFKGASPSAAECKQETRDAKGRQITWAMRLGLEMHEVAQLCAEQRLNKVLPGKFSLEQRYRVDMSTKQKELISQKEEQALSEAGHGKELKGTLKPDVVIHQGDPLDAQAVYDFKFPCVDISSVPRWNQYPQGHPFADFNQGSMYQTFIAPIIGRVIPWLGVTYD
jgi:hypothetical protein